MIKKFLLIIFFLSAITLNMASAAIVKVQSVIGTASGSDTSVSATWTSATTTGNLLVAIVGWGSGATAPSGWTSVASIGGDPGITMWYIANAASRSGAETWTSTGGNAACLTLMEYSGLIASPLDVSATSFYNTAGSPVESGTTAAVADTGGLAVAGLVNNLSTTTQGAPSNSFTSISDLTSVTTGSAGDIWTTVAHKIGSLTSGGESTSATLSTNRRRAGVIAVFRTTTPAAAPSGQVIWIE